MNEIISGNAPAVQPSSLLIDRSDRTPVERPGAHLGSMLHDGALSLPYPGGGRKFTS